MFPTCAQVRTHEGRNRDGRGELDVRACKCIGWLLLNALTADEEAGQEARKMAPLLRPIIDCMFELRKNDAHDGVRRLVQTIRNILDPPSFAKATQQEGVPNHSAAAASAAVPAAAAKSLKTMSAINSLPGVVDTTTTKRPFVTSSFCPRPQSCITRGTTSICPRAP